MEAREKPLLQEIIGGIKCQFVIPVFQRNYEWKQKECEKLFNDVLELAKSSGDYPDRKHFVGAIVYKFVKIVNQSFNQYVLIDGQQRITSITLILKALVDYLSNTNELPNVKDEILETYLTNKFVPSDNFKLKLKPNKVDNINFNRLMTGDGDIDQLSLIYRNYRYFYDRISKLEVPIEDFYNALQRLEGVSVSLDEKDNPQVIFESLNHTGIDLSDADLIRNFLLMNTPEGKQDELYNNYWIKIEQLLEKNLLGFIRDYLSFKNGSIPATKEVYSTFQKHYRNENVSIEKFLSDFLELAKIYNLLMKPVVPASDSLQKALNDFISLGMQTTYPFIFALLIDNNKEQISNDSLAGIINLIETYVLRRNICGVQGGALSQIMAGLYNTLLKKHKQNFYKNTYDKIAIYLIGITTNARFPKDDEFEREFISKDLFTNRNIFYILQKIEQKVQIKELVDFSNLTIEHVMPQKLTNEWKKVLGENFQAIHDNFKNNIGNLTLTAYNSEMSNKPFNEKKKHTDFSRLVLNQYFKSIELWNDIEIRKRANTLFNEAKSIWKYPSVKNIEDISENFVFIMEDEDFPYTGTLPVGMKVNDVNIVANNWALLISEVIKYFYTLDREFLLSLLSSEKYNGKNESFFGNNKSLFRAPEKIVDNYYIETNSSTISKIKTIKNLFEDFEIESNNIILFIQ